MISDRTLAFIEEMKRRETMDREKVSHTAFFPNDQGAIPNILSILCAEVRGCIDKLDTIYITFECGTPETVVEKIRDTLSRHLREVGHIQTISIGTCFMTSEEYHQKILSRIKHTSYVMEFA